MSFGDMFNYLAYTNPISKTTISGVSQLAKAAGIRPKSTSSVSTPANIARQFAPPLWKQLGSNYNFIRLAALSGASAVCLAAYGRHKIKDTVDAKEYRQIYESANNMHMIHSVVLLAVPLTKRPLITGSLFVIGTLLFSGTCYYKAIKKSKGEDVSQIPSQLAPYGGVCLILGWLSMLF